jgi:hypothetical protein
MANLHHLEVMPVAGGHMVRHYMAHPQTGKITQMAQHTFKNPEDVADHVEGVLSDQQEAGEESPSMSAIDREQARESGIVRGTPEEQAARRRRRHNDISPTGIRPGMSERQY